MADLKPIGSEKLQGDDKMKRILELTYYNNQNKKTSNNRPEIVTESKTGGVYGIVKEKDGYYVKRGLNESSLDYIGGLFMKNKNKFSSYAEALKRMDLLKGQEELQEATKYVLKTKPSQEEAPAAEPSMDLPPVGAEEPTSELPAEEPTAELPAEEPSTEEPSMDMGSEEGGESKRSDYMAEVQKFAGKLGQELRDQQDKMESDDIKYVLNMIISAVDLDKLDDEDIEEIGKKFERAEEGTEAQGLEGQLSEREIQDRVATCAALVDQLLSERAAERVGEEVLVLIEDSAEREGRAAHQGPEVDGTTTFDNSGESAIQMRVGSYIRGRVIGSNGADLIARA